MKCSSAQFSGTPARRILAIAMIAPVLALLAGTCATGSNPPMAAASNPLEADQSIDLRPIELPQPDAQTLSRTTWLLEQQSVPNPLYYPPEIEIVTESEPEPSRPEVTEIVRPAPFVVTSMMRGRDGNARAMIDGALFDAGDEIAPGWVIIEINPTRRHVSVRKPDGTTMLLPMQNYSD